ncbi:MAG: 4Fe-4S dicluster domain-containing protein [Thermodesulfobacteriota bacterium]
MRKMSGWRTGRRVSQVVFFALFVALAALSQVPRGFNQAVFDLTAAGRDLRLSAPVSLFFDLDPLAAVGTMLSARTLKTSLALSLALLLTVMVLGRFFCGFICPFGAANHLFTQAGRRLKLARKIALNQPRPSRRIKYYLLVLLVLAAAAGSNQTGLLDPLSFLYRGLVLAVFPGLSQLSGLAADRLAGLPQPWSYLSFAGPFVADPVLGYGRRVYAGALLIGGLFLFVLVLNRWRPRFFCRVLCPLGALLGLFSRFSLAHLTKDQDKCTNCGLCRAECQGAAGPHPEEPWLRAECHLCFNCQAACPEEALRFRLGPQSPVPVRDGPDLSRRTVLASLAGGAALLGLGRAGEASPERPRPDLIRPPGSLAEEEFLRRCIRCGLCLRVCPTNVLAPALFEAGAEGLWTPVLKFTLGYCEYSCTLCSSVCPTGAIRLITKKEKTETPLVLGSAFFDRGRCLPWSGQGPCLVCEEHCPVSPKAIYLTPLTVNTDRDRTETLLVPQVILERCVGCGICEYKCPVKGRPAVYITSVGETRSPANRILLPRKPGELRR